MLTTDKDLSEAAFHSKYGYMAGWDDARMMLYDAMDRLRKEDQDGPWPILHALWESMGTAARNEKRDAFVGVIES